MVFGAFTFCNGQAHLIMLIKPWRIKNRLCKSRFFYLNKAITGPVSPASSLERTIHPV